MTAPSDRRTQAARDFESAAQQIEEYGLPSLGGGIDEAVSRFSARAEGAGQEASEVVAQFSETAKVASQELDESVRNLSTAIEAVAPQIGAALREIENAFKVTED